MEYNLGIIRKVEYNHAYIDPMEWAPGIWAGTEGAIIEIEKVNGNKYLATIINIGLEDRYLYLDSLIEISPGDTIKKFVW